MWRKPASLCGFFDQTIPVQSQVEPWKPEGVEAPMFVGFGITAADRLLGGRYLRVLFSACRHLGGSLRIGLDSYQLAASPSYRRFSGAPNGYFRSRLQQGVKMRPCAGGQPARTTLKLLVPGSVK